MRNRQRDSRTQIRTETGKDRIPGPRIKRHEPDDACKGTSHKERIDWQKCVITKLGPEREARESSEIRRYRRSAALSSLQMRMPNDRYANFSKIIIDAVQITIDRYLFADTCAACRTPPKIGQTFAEREPSSRFSSRRRQCTQYARSPHVTLLHDPMKLFVGSLSSCRSAPQLRPEVLFALVESAQSYPQRWL